MTPEADVMADLGHYLCCEIPQLVVSDGREDTSGAAKSMDNREGQIRFSEIFTVLIFAVGETGTHNLASGTAKSYRIVHRERWQFQLFVPLWRGKYPRTQDICRNDCFRSRRLSPPSGRASKLTYT